jgi:hypothetical protein
MKRNKVEIEVWMKRNGYRAVDIQRDLEFKAHKTVFATLAGTENNRKVLTWLLEKGCPEKHLDLPDDMRKAA